MKILNYIFCAFVLTMVSCEKDSRLTKPVTVGTLRDSITPEPEDTSAAPAIFVFNFQAKLNGKDLVPSAVSYTNTSNDEYTVTKFNYYLSNLKFTTDDGVVFTEKESYHLIKHVEGKTSFTVTGIPSGNYKKIEFLIGVDSLRNVSGAQTGDLDQAHGMFWDWNSGYIFFKLEGAYTSLEVPGGGYYAIHVGGYEYKNNCIQSCAFFPGSAISAKKGNVFKIDFITNADEIFINPQKIGFDKYYSEVQNPAIFKTISENYRDMITLNKVSLQ